MLSDIKREMERQTDDDSVTKAVYGMSIHSGSKGRQSPEAEVSLFQCKRNSKTSEWISDTWSASKLCLN